MEFGDRLNMFLSFVATWYPLTKSNSSEKFAVNWTHKFVSNKLSLCPIALGVSFLDQIKSLETLDKFTFLPSKFMEQTMSYKLNYWNVELQEAYFSYKEAQLKREKENKG